MILLWCDVCIVRRLMMHGLKGKLIISDFHNIVVVMLFILIQTKTLFMVIVLIIFQLTWVFSRAPAIPARINPLTVIWGFSSKYLASCTSHFAPSSFSMDRPRLIGSKSTVLLSFNCFITSPEYHSSNHLVRNLLLVIYQQIHWLNNHQYIHQKLLL